MNHVSMNNEPTDVVSFLELTLAQANEDEASLAGNPLATLLPAIELSRANTRALLSLAASMNAAGISTPLLPDTDRPNDQ